MTCWPASRPANRRSIARSASRSTRCRALSDPVLAANLADFGRYPANKGTDTFRRSVAALAVAALRAATRARSRERGAGAERHARGPVPRRHRRHPHRAQARSRHPGPQSLLRRLFGRGARRRIAKPSSCRRCRSTDFFPISTRSTARCSRARSRSTSHSPPIRKARSPAAIIWRGWSRSRASHDFFVFADECYSEIYFGEQAGRRARTAPDPITRT